MRKREQPAKVEPVAPKDDTEPFTPLVIDQEQRARMMTGRIDRVGE